MLPSDAYHLATQKRHEAELIAQEMKERLLAHSLESPDEDKAGRAMRAFAG